MLFAALVLAALLLQIGRATFGPARGLQADYFPGERPDGRPMLSTINERVSTRDVQLAWKGAAPVAFNVRWFGYLTVTRTGRYTFGLTADDAAFLSIDGRQVVDNGGRHGPELQTGVVELAAGTHPVLIEFVQSGGGYAIEWQWARGDGHLEDVPHWALTPFKGSTSRILFARIADLCSVALLGVALCLAVMAGWRGRWSAVARRPRAAALVFFIAFAIVHTWPLATDPAHLGRHDNRDSMLNEWIVAWVAHQAPRDPVHLFDANVFYPERHTLAFSEAMIVQGIMGAPLLWLGATPVLTYAILLIAGFALNGWSMCLVIQKWTADWTAGLVSGLTFAFSAHALTRIPHLQAQHVEFLPPALFALDALFHNPRITRGLALAAWCVLQGLTSIYLLVFTIFAMVAAVAARPADWWGRRFGPAARALAVTAIVSALILLPFLLPYYHASHEQGVVRSISNQAMYAASWTDYLTTPSRFHYSLWSDRFVFGTGLFPGAIGLALTAFAILRGGALRNPRARMCLAVGLVGVLMSFGPKLPGYQWLYSAMPLLQGIRANARFGYLATVAVAAVAGFGIVALRRAVPARLWPPLSVMLVMASGLEPLAAPLGLSSFEGIPPIYAQVPRKPGIVVADLPFYGPRSAPFHAQYMLNSTLNWQPILNGYSGFQPASFYAHAAVLQGFPDDASMAMLKRVGVTHVFVHADQMSDAALALLKSRSELVPVESFGAITLYRLE